MKFLIDGQTLSTPEISRGIGVVFKRICEELVLNDISKEWLITVRDITDLRYFSMTVQQRLTPIVVGKSLNLDTYIEQTTHYSQVLNQVITEFKIDAYWNPNPLMMNVVLPTDLCNVNIFLTIYDLIPLIMHDYYIDKWSENLKIEYQRRIEKIPTWADKLIFISESAKSDFEKIDPRIIGKSIAIPLAVDHTKFWSSLAPRNKYKIPYILFTGGFDPRKNMNAALEAFAYLIKNNDREFDHLKFYVVCACSDKERQNYEKLAAKLGILDKLVLTGYIEEEDLIALYKGASVFFFPSLYEGFGLPVLEALACGLPVVTTKISSIPEIVGDLAYYCSPNDSQDMAYFLKKALQESSNGNIRRQEYVRRAKEFTWAKTGASYFKLFNNTLFALDNSIKLPRQKIAYVSPWPPQRSGIANYSFEIVRHLKEYVDITLYLENPEESNAESFGLEVEDISLLPQNRGKYDCVIYHIGNNKHFHQKIYQMAWKYPGIVVVHDFNIHPFLADSFLGKKDEYLYADALIEGYAEDGKSSYASVKSDVFYPEIWKFPMSHALVKRSIATIVHSQWVKKQLQEVDNVFVVPHGSIDNRTMDRSNNTTILKKHFDISPDNFVISTFGFVNALKRVSQVLEAIKVLVDLGYPVKFLIGGNLIDPSLKIEEKIQSLGISSNVVISGYLSDENFDDCIKMSDIIINLRCPSLGESSGALMKALSYAKACLVSNYQQFTELPDSVCWKVDIGEIEVPLIVAYLEELMRNPSIRKQLGNNAAFFAANYSSYEFAAKSYATIISKVIQANQSSLLK
jgi:glycosyltransferase involved in cell wall biosynthesis